MSEIVSLVSTLAKALFWVCIAYLIYTLYRLLYLPWKARRHFSKYKNVDMIENYIPFLGDLKTILDYRRDNKFQFYFVEETALNKPDKDLRLTILGANITLDVITIKAQDEFEKLVPMEIDRHHNRYYPAWYGLKGSFALTHSTEYWKTRRTSALKLMNMNALSKYHPKIVKIVDDVIGSLNINTPSDFSTATKAISFRVICMITCGTDMYNNLPMCEYIDQHTKEKRMMDAEKTWAQIDHDLSDTVMHPLGRIFPFLKGYPIVDPYKTLLKNITHMIDTFKKASRESKDKSSLYHQLMALGTIAEVDVANDAAAIISAGMDTTSDFISGALYHLKKAPHKLEKLMQEMKECGLDILKKKNLTDAESEEISEKIQSCDYLNYTCKEVLRLNPPGFISIKYHATKDTRICGVDIPKGTVIDNFTMGPALDKTQWHTPTEFIPERFDPNSEYFNKPGTNQPRHPKCLIPFSHGLRTCPGKVLSMFETKIVLARLLHRIEYEVDKDMLDNPTMLFYLQSQYKLKATVTKKYD